jgi:hypothetical protein
MSKSDSETPSYIQPCKPGMISNDTNALCLSYILRRYFKNISGSSLRCSFSRKNLCDEIDSQLRFWNHKQLYVLLDPFENGWVIGRFVEELAECPYLHGTRNARIRLPSSRY